MALSDVQVINISDENASDDDRIVTAARPDTTATLATTTFLGGGARNVTVTTTGTGDNAKTCTITGTDVFGSAMTEVITSTGSAEAVAGTKLFLTVSAVECSAKYAANITVGSGTAPDPSLDADINSGNCRLLVTTNSNQQTIKVTRLTTVV